MKTNGNNNSDTNGNTNGIGKFRIVIMIQIIW